MTRIDFAHFTLCMALGPALTFDQASAFCYSNYNSRLCTLSQYRDVACNAGVGVSGTFWTDAPVGAGTYATILGCTSSGLGTAPATSQRNTMCCVEWMRY